MPNTVDNLILDLVEWVERTARTYEETMAAWRTSCPRLPIWEEANEHGFIETVCVDGRSMIRATPDGLAFLHENRPQVYEELPQRRNS